MKTIYLESIKKRFEYYKNLGDKTFEQLTDESFFWQYNNESNSIATIVYHISGNMISRWTDFLTTDGENPTRNRDGEFINIIKTKKEVIQIWENGWKVFWDALHQINEENIESTIYIRGEAHSAVDAINRQLAHYPYHIGQIIYIAKMLKDNDWRTLSIAKNSSEEFNKKMFENLDIENSSPVCYAKSNEVREDFK